MTEVKYTSDQLRAIETRGKNIIVSAQAGAGKTQVLVERIIRLIREEKIDIDSMLIVTFTNKAAYEMKDRIKKQIVKSMEVDRENMSFYKNQYNNINSAQISTMHSFCINTIREYFYKLDISPDFIILNQASLDILKHQALDEVYSNYYEKRNEDFLTFIEKYDSRKNDENTRDLILRIYSFLMSQIDPWTWMEEAIEPYDLARRVEEGLEDESAYESYYLAMVKSLLEKPLDDLYKASKEALDLAEMDDGPEPYRDLFERESKMFLGLKKALEEDDLASLKEALDGVDFKTLPRLTKKKMEDNLLDPLKKDRAKALRDGYKKDFSKIADLVSLDMDQARRESLESFRTLKTMEMILRDFDRAYRQKKRDKKGIDFSDAEHLMIELLEDQDVVELLRDKYSYIFFDEYQDANQIQNYIVEKIRREDNLFFVGDIKQSIYKFRLADPSLFNKRYEDYRKFKDLDQAIDLNKNFRSRKELLDFNNFIFDSLMTKKLGEIDYRSPSHQLVKGTDFPDLKDPVEFLYLKTDKDEIEDLDIAYSTRFENTESFAIAKRIKEMVDFEGYDYRDFAILSRTKSDIGAYEEDLKAFNIPFFSDSYEVDFSNLEVLNFINLLKCIENDRRDLPLMAVLLSHLGDFTEEELSLIKIENRSGSFNHSFFTYDGENESILEKRRSYMEKIDSYRDREKTMTLVDFAWYVLLDSGYLAFVLSLNNGKQKYDNLLAFIDEIGKYEENSDLGLYGFLSYVDDLMKKDKSQLEPGADLSEEDNVVRIMTIHKSKGLQFRVVFIANLNKRFNMMDLRNPYIYHNDLGMALRVVDLDRNARKETLEYNLIKEEIRKESLSEEVRILYVAMTRAIDKLVLVGKLPNKFREKDYGKDLTSMSSYFDWINSIVFRDCLADDFKLEEELEIPSDTDYFEGSFKPYFNLVEEAAILEEIDEYKSSLEEDEKDLDLMEMDLDPIFDYEYPFKDYIKAPYKKTVSDLSEKNDNRSSDFKRPSGLSPYERERDLDFARPDFIRGKEKLKANEKGSLIHKVFELVEIKKYSRESFLEELDRLVAWELLQKEDLAYIDPQIFINFFDSDLGERIIANRSSLHRERAFTIKYQKDGIDLLVDGQIDLFFIEDGEIVIVDFKTNRSIDEDLYQGQLALYKRGLESSLNIRVKEAYIYWARHNVFTRIDHI